MQEMQRNLRAGAEERALVHELRAMEAQLHSVGTVASTASSLVTEEQERRVRAEAALERYTRISALQRAASEVLQFGMGSPGRADPAADAGSEEALQRLAAEIRASGLGAPSRGHTPRSQPSATPRSQQPTPRDGGSSARQSPFASGSVAHTTNDTAGLFSRGGPGTPLQAPPEGGT